jgi:hypothetical protein
LVRLTCKRERPAAGMGVCLDRQRRRSPLQKCVRCPGRILPPEWAAASTGGGAGFSSLGIACEPLWRPLPAPWRRPLFYAGGFLRPHRTWLAPEPHPVQAIGYQDARARALHPLSAKGNRGDKSPHAPSVGFLRPGEPLAVAGSRGAGGEARFRAVWVHPGAPARSPARATGITNYLLNGSTLERAPAIAGYASIRTSRARSCRSGTGSQAIH